MAKTDNLGDFLTDMAKTLRTEENSTSSINPQNFSSKVSSFGRKLRMQNNKLEKTLGVYPVPVEPVLYGVKLDKSVLTGTEWASYTDDAEGLSGAYMDFDNDVFVDNGWNNRFPFNQIKPCIINDGKVVGYVNPNDYNYYEDGTPTNINVDGFGCLMVEFPKIYYKISKDDSYIYIQISNVEREGFVCNAHTYKGEELDKLYISVYICGHRDFATYGFNMTSGSFIAKNSIGYEKDYNVLKTKTGERFEFMPFNVMTLLQCLFAIMFKSTNCQLSLGYGYPGDRQTFLVGSADEKGMYYGTRRSGSSTKLFGLEDTYACKATIVTGFYIDENKRPRFIDPYDENSSYNPSYLDSYITNDSEFVMTGQMIRMTTDINEDANNVGFMPSAKSSKVTDGFCDGCSQISALSSCCQWGTRSDNYNNGLYSISTVAANKPSLIYTTRLVYYPEG